MKHHPDIERYWQERYVVLPQDYSAIRTGEHERNLWGICIDGQEQAAIQVHPDGDFKYWLESDWHNEKEMVRLLKLRAFL